MHPHVIITPYTSFIHHPYQRLTSHQVPEANGGQGDEGVVQGVVICPVLQVNKSYRREEHEHDEPNAEVDPRHEVQQQLAVALRVTAVTELQ